jgi:hypothetical protein
MILHHPSPSNGLPNGLETRCRMRRSSERVRLEDGLKLNLNQLLKQGDVVRARRVRADVTWPQPYSGEPAASCVLTSDLSHPVRGWMHLKLGAVEQSFWLVTEPRHFGGKQCYSRCPRTDRRLCLRKSPGDDRFLSRQACGRRSPRAPNSRSGTTRRVQSAGRRGLGGSCFADSMASFPKPRRCTGGRTNEKSRGSKPSKTAANFILPTLFRISRQIRFLACVYPTVSIYALYQWVPRLSARPMFRSSAG